MNEMKFLKVATVDVAPALKAIVLAFGAMVEVKRKYIYISAFNGDGPFIKEMLIEIGLPCVKDKKWF